MKTTTKKTVAKKKVATKKVTNTTLVPEEVLATLTGEQIKAVEEFTGQEQGKKKYTATITMGSLSATSSGNDEHIFTGLSIPKVTGKCILRVKNNDNNKVFETVVHPFMAKKLLTNIFVQKFQWKRVIGKLD